MQNKLVKIFRILFVLILVTLGVLVLFKPAHTETNILKAIFSSKSDNLLVDLSSRFSAKINIIVESNDFEKAEEVSKTIYAKIDKTKMKSSDANITEIIEEYEKYHNNLLSNQTRKYLINKQYDKVEENAYEALYNPVIPPVGSIEDDPFLLLTDFVMNLNKNSQAPSSFTPIQQNDKFYSLVMLDVDKELALSPTVLNKEVKKLVDIQKEFSKNGTKVYLTGAPIHSYFASSHSIFEINLICILSTLFVIGLVFWYFGSLSPLIPIGLSIGLGIYAGYCMTALVFRNIHILTFVFSTTLIGVCVDYSLHYFVALKEGKTGTEVIKDIFKSLTVSLITTVSAFLILLFADFTLLRQISIFTITGLVTVYGIVVLWYPLWLNRRVGKTQCPHETDKGTSLDAKIQRCIEAKSVSEAAKKLGSEAAKCDLEAKTQRSEDVKFITDLDARQNSSLLGRESERGVELNKYNMNSLLSRIFNTHETVHASKHLGIFASKPRLTAQLLSCLIAILLIIGLFHTHFDDNIKNMYTPPKTLLNAEKLFTEIAGTSADTSIFVVKGNNLEELLQKEEEIADKLNGIEYQALSKYVPSEKRQKSNQILRKELYRTKLNDFAIFLPVQKRSQLISQNYGNNFLSVNNDFEFMKKNFLIDKNTSIMVVSGYNGEKIDGVRIINFQKDISAQIKHCRRVCLGLLIPIFGLLYLLLAKIYDKKSGLKILLPSICAVILVFGILGLFGCSINLFHLLAIFLIIGCGLDYSVFRFTNPEKAGDSVFLSCITTVFSFALLAFAGFKLISSLGTVLSLGLLSSYIFSLKLIEKDIKKDKNEV